MVFIMLLSEPKKLLYVFVLPILITGLVITFVTVHASRAASAFTSLTAYHIPSGLDPWGTAFDSTGNVWVAIPECDPNPDCIGTVGQARIEVFNPSSASWIATYRLPAG